MKTRLLVLCWIIVLASLTACQAAELPLTRVALFTSGVGYFERTGTVQGNTTVELTFRTEQINDILKSLVLQDLSGGTIAPVTYASQEPLARTLSSFSVNISDNPSLRELWDRLRGAQARLTVGGTVVEGTAFGSEVHQVQGEDVTTQIEYLNLLTPTGLMQFPLSQVTSIKLLDPKLDADLQKALAAIDQARDTDRKSVVLSFNGTGERKVRVGYLLETPLWKTTYRLVSDQDGLFLQGWALVENMTDDDWNDIGLSLISGRPVSFTQDLYQPLYLPRPQVPVQVAAAARPRVLEGAMERRDEAQEADLTDRVGALGGGGGAALRRATKPAAPPAAMADARGPAGPAGPPGESLARGRAASMAAGGQVGTLFQYAIAQPVTIPRQRSAMIPIISQKVEGEKVSVYNQSADPRHPMNGIRLKNTSKLHLMGGAITVFDGGAYGGDALIEDIPPGDERLLAYAMDLAVEVEPQAKSQPDQLLTAKVVNGVMSLSYKRRLETTYVVKNAAQEKRLVLIEHPLRPDWKLIEPKEPAERTRSVYRFRVPVDPGKTEKLLVVEEFPRLEEVVLGRGDMTAARLYVSRTELSEKLRAALQQIVKLQDELAALTAQRTEKETRIKEIEQEQARLRSNMRELDRAGELYKQYVEKLTKQEAEFEALRVQIADLRAQEMAKRKELSDYITALNIE
jgi:hypothetical protein